MMKYNRKEYPTDYKFNYTIDYVVNKIKELGINRDTFHTKLLDIIKIANEDIKKYKMKKIGLKKYFMRYPYKCQVIKGTTIPAPFVKKEDINCDNYYGLTYKEYSKYAKVYFKYLLLYLLSGLQYKLPARMGTLVILNYNGGYYDHNERSYDGNDYLSKTKFVLKWLRNKHIRNNYFWDVKFNRRLWKQIFNWIEVNPSRIYNFNKLSPAKNQFK